MYLLRKIRCVPPSENSSFVNFKVSNARDLTQDVPKCVCISKASLVTPAQYQSCLRYTLLAKLAPNWNKAGQWLIQGRDFLMQAGYANAVSKCLNIFFLFKFCVENQPLVTKLQVLKEKLLPRHPPVFKEWFLRTFQDPTSWYNARVSYARTAAVMSMVGYILGLGDRHGENILFDSTNGDCVHVDFNCLFNKGTTFEWPERVPFRLTHNMIDAMGPMGYEGIFRKASEVTLRVMRTQMDPLMSVLKPFIYDPLVEWSKPVKPQGQRSALVPGQRSIVIDTGEINNEQAMKHVQDIEDRLKGILKNEPKQGGQAKPKSVALSIEGHVNHLINVSTWTGMS
ncbi:serine/threonine-protein kinase ATR [Mytilus galloprovincialis]|uniref:Serine/threonine-protein kinase ATR n=1 Tax=Mytilus galloprovincialis TaxID=29158 RepID=A0A8B6FJV8_MYTGA|nr:serine/threonine-protein kinase ATR [Mytilus galloprovincialis]